MDDLQALASGTVPGAKRAAVRKLLHELGIPREQLPVEKFKYLTRLHYCAADTVTWGPNSPWGEHEVGRGMAGLQALIHLSLHEKCCQAQLVGGAWFLEPSSTTDGSRYQTTP